MEKFKNRKDAGKKLALQLLHLKTENPIVLALPRGGIPVACEIVKSLKVPLNLLIVKKIGVPWHLELAAGAVTEGAEPFFNKEVLSTFGLTPSDLKDVIEEKRYEIASLKEKFGTSHEELEVEDRTVILVDDGIATGSTARMAIRLLRQMKAKKIVLAAPVGAKSTLDNLREVIDQVVAVHEPEDLVAVGYFYEDFTQVSEAEAVTQFKKARYLPPDPKGGRRNFADKRSVKHSS